MTEQSYQECRKVMQKANSMRGLIIKAKGEVSKWTKMEMWHREQLNENQANGAKKMVEKSLKKLEERRKSFSELKFPDNNIPNRKKEVVQCEGCGSLIAKGNTYCGECLCED
jgi:predicted translin family RNA/ssDNA-binding protein